MTYLSRRRLLTSGAAASMLAATGLPARAAAGGVLRLAVTARGPGRLQDAVLASAVFGSLTKLDAGGALRGDLATAWEADSDARGWSFTLRRDATFHDGTPVHAGDVAAALAKVTLSQGAELRADGPHKLRITLAQGDPGLPFLLADPRFVIAKEGFGTGPYRREGSALVAWSGAEDAARPFGRIDLVEFEDPRDLIRAVIDGRADAAEVLDPAGLRPRNGRPAVTALAAMDALQITARGRHADALAQGLKVGIDRAALVQGWLGGHGTVATDCAMAAGPAAAAADPGTARAVLRHARIADARIELSEDLLHCPSAARLLQALAREARMMGLSLALRDRSDPRPADLALSLRRVRLTPEATLAEHPRDGLGRLPGFDARLAALRAAPTTAERQDLLAALSQDVAHHSTTVIPVLRHMVVAHTPRLSLAAEATARTGPDLTTRWAFA